MRWQGASSVAVLVLALTLGAVAQAQPSLVGKRAPDFTRTALDGKTVQLSKYRGQVVLLNFWATWCAPCQAELPRFAMWQKQLHASGLQVLAVSMDDSPRQPQAMMRKLALNFPVVMGGDELGTQYGGVLGLPVTFLITRDGTVAARIEGETDLKALETRIKTLLAQR